MPLQNRVSPFGGFEAVAARGTLMGNRGGALHDEARRLGTSRWKGTRWIACTLAFKGRRRTVMAPRRYSELFFLDEATAFAAGHRPCAECRRLDFVRFAAAWAEARQASRDERPGADEIDVALHADRLDGRRQRRHRATLSALPDGAMVCPPDGPEQPHLLWRGTLRAWSHDGYGPPRAVDRSTHVDVLTPRGTVAAFLAGYEPGVHPSAAVTEGRS